MADAVFPDNTVLCNFAAVERLDLLEGFLRGRGRWTDAVAYEAEQSGKYAYPNLATVADAGWLREPVEVVGDDANDHVEHLRRDVFGGDPDVPTMHLGEAQTCYLIKEVPEWKGSWWVSDDGDALDFARKQGITTRETIDIVKHLVADGDLTVQGGWDLMQEMVDRDRHLRLPKAPEDLTR